MWVKFLWICQVQFSKKMISGVLYFGFFLRNVVVVRGAKVDVSSGSMHNSSMTIRILSRFPFSGNVKSMHGLLSNETFKINGNASRNLLSIDVSWLFRMKSFFNLTKLANISLWSHFKWLLSRSTNSMLTHFTNNRSSIDLRRLLLNDNRLRLIKSRNAIQWMLEIWL